MQDFIVTEIESANETNRSLRNTSIILTVIQIIITVLAILISINIYLLSFLYLRSTYSFVVYPTRTYTLCMDFLFGILRRSATLALIRFRIESGSFLK